MAPPRAMVQFTPSERNSRNAPSSAINRYVAGRFPTRSSLYSHSV